MIRVAPPREELSLLPGEEPLEDVRLASDFLAERLEAAGEIGALESVSRGRVPTT
jgi:hypothetical protein